MEWDLSISITADRFEPSIGVLLLLAIAITTTTNNNFTLSLYHVLLAGDEVMRSFLTDIPVL